MTEKTSKFKQLRFIDPISKKSVSLKIKRALIEEATNFPVSITYFQENHAIILYIDKNFSVRGVETTIFVDNKKEQSKQIDIDSLDVSHTDVLDEIGQETKEDAIVGEAINFSDEKLLSSIKEKLSEGDIEGKLNILILGSARVGKTSLIYRYLFDFFKPSYIISEDVKKFNHNVHTLVGTAADVVLWDIPGQINPELLRERFKDKINGIICIFDVTRKETFEDVKNIWIPLLKDEFKSIEIIYLANKIDLTDERAVYKDTIDKISMEQDITIFETSVSSKMNVIESLDDMILATYLKSS